MLKNIFRGTSRSADQAGGGSPFMANYEQRFAPLLGGRASGFRAIFQLLEARCQSLAQPGLIIETGSMRVPGNWAGDGQSTVLWKEFASVYDMEVHTVDLEPDAARVVRQECGAAVQAHTGDSVRFLYDFANSARARQIDLLYLDSFDFDAKDPFPSAFHHIKELIAVRPCLGPGSIVAIDDNFVVDTGGFTGKGYLAMQWFDHLGIPCAHQGHQFVWQL
ncbi:MAG TPA: class I SAM-dependent methyltransferase [Burkholderiales bacterium]|jgi:hypothetical protein|nr:class I SAM-dependent methyltransferase [Burkholderiales bacterium]